jgi:hypothetical protein
MTEKEKAICADATSGNGRAVCSIDSVVVSSVRGLGPMGTIYSVKPVDSVISAGIAVGLVIIVAPLLALGAAAYGLYKWFKN